LKEEVSAEVLMKFNHTTFFSAYKEQYGALTQLQVSGLDNLLTGVESDPNTTDLRWAAYMLATVKHECADKYQPITEYGGKSYFNKYDAGTRIGKNLGNTVKGDGYLYRGRGYVQLTGRANYQKMSVALALTGSDDLIAYPDHALHPDIAYKIMSYGMRNGSFTGKKLSDYITGTTCDFVNARRIINGVDCAMAIKGYAVNFEEFLAAATVKS
jgi:putative chitinase